MHKVARMSASRQKKHDDLVVFTYTDLQLRHTTSKCDFVFY